MDGKKTSGSWSQVSMSTQANVGDGMQSSSVLRGLKWSLTDSSEIMRLVVDNPVGVQRKTVEMMTARVQTDENDDAGVRPVMTALLRTSTEMPDKQTETGFLDGASLAHRFASPTTSGDRVNWIPLRLGALWSTDQWASNGSVESHFSFRCLRQGSVEDPRWLQKMASQILANVEEEWMMKRKRRSHGCRRRCTSNMRLHVG